MDAGLCKGTSGEDLQRKPGLISNHASKAHSTK